MKNIGINGENFPEYLLKAAQRDSDLIVKAIKEKYGEASGEIGKKFGFELGQRVAVSLVTDCNTHFTLVDSLRYKDYENLNQDSLRLQLTNLDKEVNVKNAEDFYVKNAMFFFELKSFNSSLAMIEKLFQ